MCLHICQASQNFERPKQTVRAIACIEHQTLHDGQLLRVHGACKDMVLFAAFASDQSMVDKADHHSSMTLQKDSPSEATTTTTSSSSSAASIASLDLAESEYEMPKPFFIMDFLDKVDSRALEKAQRILQIPKNPKSFTTKPVVNGFLKRSISMGNGWNAKGLQRAQDGKWDDAFTCWRNAMEIRSQCLGEDHIDTANTANNIGIALGKLDRINEAIEYLQRALEIRIQQLGRENSQVAATFHNLGNVFQQGGRLEEAVNCFHESKKLHEKLGGPYHVEVARNYVSMGHTYAQANQFQDAREAYSDALYVFQRAGLVKNNVEVQTVMTDIRELDSLLLQQAKS